MCSQTLEPATFSSGPQLNQYECFQDWVLDWAKVVQPRTHVQEKEWI